MKNFSGPLRRTIRNHCHHVGGRKLHVPARSHRRNHPAASRSSKEAPTRTTHNEKAGFPIGGALAFTRTPHTRKPAEPRQARNVGLLRDNVNPRSAVWANERALSQGNWRWPPRARRPDPELRPALSRTED